MGKKHERLLIMQYSLLLHAIFTVHKQFEGFSPVFSETAGIGCSKTQKTWNILPQAWQILLSIIAMKSM